MYGREWTRCVVQNMGLMDLMASRWNPPSRWNHFESVERVFMHQPPGLAELVSLVIICERQTRATTTVAPLQPSDLRRVAQYVAHKGIYRIEHPIRDCNGGEPGCRKPWKGMIKGDSLTIVCECGNMSYTCCFDGSGTVQLSQDARGRVECPVRDLRRGDWICLPDGSSARLECVVRTRCEGGQCLLARLPGSGVLLTPGHPVRLSDGQWHYAAELGVVDVRPCEYVYNCVLSRGHVIVINGAECATLAHGFTEEKVRHPFWGSQRVVEHLRAQSGWSAGLVDLCRRECRADCATALRAKRMSARCTGATWLTLQLSLLREMKEAHRLGSPVPDAAFLRRIHGAMTASPEGHSAFRCDDIYIVGQRHHPSPPAALLPLVSKFCDETRKLAASGADRFVVGAFCLWWLGHVHPFSDGNGRTARSLCFLAAAQCGLAWSLSSPPSLKQSATDLFAKAARWQEGVQVPGASREQYVGALQAINEELGRCACCGAGRARGSAAVVADSRALRRLATVLRKSCG